MTVNSRKVFDYLKENYGKNLTAQEVAAALDIALSAVTGSVNGLVKKGYAVRTDSGKKNDMGKPINFVGLTEAGCQFNPDAEADK